MVRVCPSQNVVLTRCPCPQPLPRVYIRTHKHDHGRMLEILQSMSEFGGLRKHKKTQHALAGLGSAALAADVVLPR